MTEPLLTAAQVSASNLLKVTLEAAYSVPESFMPVGPQQNYMVGLQVPSVGEVKPCSQMSAWVQASLHSQPCSSPPRLYSDPLYQWLRFILGLKANIDFFFCFTCIFSTVCSYTIYTLHAIYINHYIVMVQRMCNI